MQGAVQHLLREVVANAVKAVEFKRDAQVGECCPNATFLLIYLH